MSGVPTCAEVGERLSRTRLLDSDVSRLRYVSKSRRAALGRLGIHTVRDLLLHLPHRYLDFTRVVDIAHADVGMDATIVATVDKVSLKRPRPRLQLVELYALDSTGVIQVAFFRQPWIAEQVRPGTLVALSGKVGFAYGFKQMSSPFMEVLETDADGADYARILPVHPVGEGISAAWMRRICSAALADVGDVCDHLPAGLVAGRGLMTFARALREIHFPTSMRERELARRRLAYDELLGLQLALLTRRRLELGGGRPYVHKVDGPHMDALLGALPFTLTGEQRQAADEILGDMAAGQVMSRLLLGDVGTGKTAVAALALAAVCDSGYQAAFMAPTSVLAKQHARRLGPLLDAAHIPWHLVVGSTEASERAQIRGDVRGGTTCVLFGTTALLSDDIVFKCLSLVVIDEQHRFGVDQRAALRQKGPMADTLAMTATPIPRTLALSIYGDMSCSRIRHRPLEGSGVKTSCIPPENVDLAYGAVLDACAAGRQAYVICPLIDEADAGEGLDDVPEKAKSAARQLHAATTTRERLARGPFSKLSVDLLTGRMGTAEKDAAMERFAAGETDVLVSTTVVEVGVDVEAATVMVVFDADRFGLATLHQLRGRVGRGRWPGEVYLVCAAKAGTPARKRLQALEKTNDGFELAELDLKIRHEGEVLGYRQSGAPVLKISDLEADEDLVTWAHGDARRLFEADPELSQDANRPLALELRARFGAYFEEIRGQ